MRRLIATGLLLAVLGLVLGSSGPATASGTQPQTAYQCKKKFKPHTRARAACLHRVAMAAHLKATAGSSCANPLVSGQAVDGAPYGDTKDFSVTETGTRGQTVADHRTLYHQMTVTIHNPRIVICSREYDVYDTFQQSGPTRIVAAEDAPPGGVPAPDTGFVIPIVKARLS